MPKIKSPLAATQGVVLNKPLALLLHVMLTGAFSGAVYYLATQYVDAQQQQQLQQFGKQASALISLYGRHWQQQAQLLAQQPDLHSQASLTAVIPAEGGVPPSLSYANQDLLNRSRQHPTLPELSGSQDKVMVSTAQAMPHGGYALFEWPAKPLLDDLKRITPDNLEIKFSQELAGTAPLEILRVHAHGNDGRLQNVPLANTGWRLAVAQDSPARLPLWLGLLSFLSGFVPALVWAFRPSPSPAAHASHSTVLEDILPPSPGLQQATQVSSLPQSDDPRVETSSSLKNASYLENRSCLPDDPAIAPASQPDSIADALDSLRGLETPNPPTTQHHNGALEFSLDAALLPQENQKIHSPHIPKYMFRAYDIRGAVEDLSNLLMGQIGRALGAQLREQHQYQVAVGYDARISSAGYARQMQQALKDSGLTVIDIGMASSPLLYFAAKQHDGNGIMITASHNPAADNGVKWLIQQQSPTPDDINTIYQRIVNGDFVEGMGTVQQQSYQEAYLALLQEEVMLSQPLAISIDCMNGSTGELALAAFGNAGCVVSSLNTQANGLFPNGAPDPTKPQNLQELSNDIIISNSQIGFAFDGDGDRVVVLDSQGNAVSPDALICLFAKMCLDSNPGSDIIIDVKCSRLISNLVTHAGGRAVMVRTGNTFLRAALNNPEYQAVFAGEFSGHYFFNDQRGHGQDDGIYAALRLLEWLDMTGQTIEQALASIPPHVATDDLYLPLNGRDASQLFTDLTRDAAKLADATLNTLDGIRLDFEHGFGIIRPSNTGDYLTARFDADSNEDLHQIRAVFSGLVMPYDAHLAQLIVNM